MKEAGFYSDRAIVNGEQIYVFYYVMDHFNYNYNISGPENKKRVLDSVDRYYDIIEKQVVITNDKLEMILRDRPLNVWSY